MALRVTSALHAIEGSFFVQRVSLGSFSVLLVGEAPVSALVSSSSY